MMSDVMAKATVLGVHRIEADEPIYLIEIAVEGRVDAFDFGEVTQEDPREPRENWQVAYDEQLLERSEGGSRFAFFFHCLDLQRPLLTSFGLIPLPKSTDVPDHLEAIRYDAP